MEKYQQEVLRTSMYKLHSTTLFYDIWSYFEQTESIRALNAKQVLTEYAFWLHTYELNICISLFLPE